MSIKFLVPGLLLASPFIVGLTHASKMCVSKKTFASIVEKASLEWQGATKDGAMLLLLYYPSPMPGSPMPGAWTIYRYKRGADQACVVDFGQKARRRGDPDFYKYGDPVEPPKH